MKHLPCIALCLCLTATLAAAQDLDENGPGIAVLAEDPNGGILDTGEVMSRNAYRDYIHSKRTSAGFVERYGYPRAMLRGGRNMHPIFMRRSTPLEQIDRILNGDGKVRSTDLALEDAVERQIFGESTGTANRPNSIDLDEVAAAQGPIELFEGVYNTITLQDGRWISKVHDMRVTGCPSGIAEAASAHSLASFDRQVTFSAPWHPSDFGQNLAQFSWRAVGANGYFSEIFDLGGDAAGSGMDLSVTVALNPVSPQQINVWTRVHLVLSPMLAKIAGGSESCTAIARGRYAFATQ
ncbi:hypothetical protein [Roseibium sp. SCP14]|uniref:hypothetical protein n=1 Tax=Roseibium sp. SCP14 TaxID=3141375 RepID=UPI0033385AA6